MGHGIVRCYCVSLLSFGYFFKFDFGFRNIVNSVCYFGMKQLKISPTSYLNLAYQPKATHCEPVWLLDPSNDPTWYGGWSGGKCVLIQSYDSATLNLCLFVSFGFEVVTIWFGISIVPFVGRGYAGVIAFIPATVGAILVNALPSHNKVGLLLSYWVSSKFLSTFNVLSHDHV